MIPYIRQIIFCLQETDFVLYMQYVFVKMSNYVKHANVQTVHEKRSTLPFKDCSGA